MGFVRGSNISNCVAIAISVRDLFGFGDVNMSFCIIDKLLFKSVYVFRTFLLDFL